MKIGFIGLGRMGRGMAANLVKAGHEVTVYNRTPGKEGDLEALGARVGNSIADACRGDVVMTMLANDEAVESVVFGNDGILTSLPKGAIHVSSSTISVALSDRLSDSHANAGQRYVAATVLGRPDVAAKGELFVVAAGASDAVRDSAPLLDAIGKQTTLFGDKPSRANLIKLSSNFLIASVFESLGEAIALVSKGGIDRRAYLEFLTTTVFDSPLYRNYGALIVEDDPAPVGFAAPLGFKDIRLAIAAGEALRVPMPLAGLLHDRFVELLAKEGEERDWSEIGKLPRRDAGESRGAAELARGDFVLV
jgi:3-hydroxyisobutyrate dehydrogenase-like beta-hydroxyacid dehydrogenase